MGEPIIIWPPNCGNFAPGDDAAVCTDQGYIDCTSQAPYFDQLYGTQGYEQLVSEGYMLCC